MAAVAPTPLSNIPDFPALSDRAAGTYNSKAYAFGLHMSNTFNGEMDALADNVFDNATEAASSATTATTQVGLAAAQVALATAQAVAAAGSATAASVTANASAWVNGGTYALNSNAISGVDSQTYRKKTASSVTSVDPSSDTANWVKLGGSMTLFRSPRTSNTLLGATDNAKLIDITSGTFSQTFDAAATLGDGWYCYIRNAGTGDITLDPSGSETIDGLTSFAMYPGEVRLVQCDGAALRTVFISAPNQIYTGGTAYPERNNTLTAAGTATIPLGLPAGRKGTVTKTVETTTINSADGWTYRSLATVGTTEVVPFQGTGTLRPYVGGWSPTPPSVDATGNGGVSNCISSYLHSIIDTGTHLVLGTQAAAAGNALKVHKTTGAATIVDIGGTTGNDAGNYYGGLLHYSVANDKYVCIYSNTSSYLLAEIRNNAFARVADSGSFGPSCNLRHSLMLSDTSFVLRTIQVSGLYAVSVNYGANTVTIGSEYAGFANVTRQCLARLSDTTFLEIAPTSAGGTISARVNTVSGTTITLGTTYQSADSDTQNQGVFLVKLSDTKFIAMVGKNSGTTLGYAYGISVSGTVVTFTSRLAIPSNNTTYPWFDFSGYLPCKFLVLDAERVLVPYSSGVYVVKYSGSTLSVGSTLSITSCTGLLTDLATRTNQYYQTASAWGRLTVADTAVSIDYTVSSGGSVTCVFKEGLSNREFRGSDGTWYAFPGVLPTLNYAITPTIGFRTGSGAKSYKELTT